MKFPNAPNQLKAGGSIVLFLLLCIAGLFGVAAAVLDGQSDANATLVLFLETRESKRVDGIAESIAALRSVASVTIQTPLDASAELAELAAPKKLDISPSKLPYRIRFEPAFGFAVEDVERELAPFLLQPTVSDLVVTDSSKTFFRWTKTFGFVALIFTLLALLSVWLLATRSVDTVANRQWKRALLALGVSQSTLRRNMLAAGARRGGMIGLGVGIAIACSIIWLHFNAAGLAIRMDHVSYLWIPVIAPIVVAPCFIGAAQGKTLSRL